MRRRWTGGSIQKVKIAKRDKTARQHEYFEKKKVDVESNIPKRVNETVFQSFSGRATEKEVQDPPNMEKTESYLSKDYLLLTSRSNKNKTIKSEDAVVQEKEELRTLPDPQPVQMPTTIAADMGTMPRIVDKLDKVLFIDEGHDRTEDVYLALHAERLLLARGHDAAQQSTYDVYPEAGDKLGYNQLLDAALLMREQ